MAHIKKTKAQNNTTEYVNIQQRVENKQTNVLVCISNVLVLTISITVSLSLALT